MIPVSLPATALVTYLCMFALWLISLGKRDVSIVDFYWGPGFALVTVVAAMVGVGTPDRQALVASLVTAWGLRLGFHLFRRNRSHGEDRRYQAMRAAQGPHFPWLSLLTVFGLQGTLLLIISWPLQVAVTVPGPPLGLWDGLGAGLFVLGFLTEAVADRQLRAFLLAPEQRGQVLDTGLWRYSRHPNYFGDALLWWGFGAFGMAVAAPWTLLGPVLMTFFLLKVSGVTLLERNIGERRPGYAEYVRRTSAFVPWPPRSR